jgi:hypothetical protein
MAFTPTRPTFFRSPHARNTRDDHEEYERPHHHLHHLDEEFGERFQRSSDLGEQPSGQRTEKHRDQDLRREVEIPFRRFAARPLRIILHISLYSAAASHEHAIPRL